MGARAIIETAWREPMEVLSAFADEPWAVGLVSDGESDNARWSYLARKPSRTLTISPDDSRDALAALADLAGEPVAPAKDGPPFQGGCIGLAAYELGERLDSLGLARHPDWPDLVAAHYPSILAFDHREQRTVALGESDEGATEALGWLDEAAQPEFAGPLAPGPNFEAAEVYEAAVADVVTRIAAGEIFQANIARRWTGRLAGGARPFDLAARMAQSSPAPFAAYLRLTDKAVVSNSPERFVSVSTCKGRFEARSQPIKGTRPRSADPLEDAANAAALAASPKDRAENLMIVDLMRNDLSRVCPPGSVRTTDLFAVESFANVHHLVSTVVGDLRPGLGPIDVLRAAFPPGSITGAPKLQAMKVIAGLEPPRGPFFGSMFWIGPDGAMDSNVLIRTVLFDQDATGWSFETRAGAGIVADSDPRAERLETEDKIAAILAAMA